MELVTLQSEIEKGIFTIKDVQVVLDKDIAIFYQVATSRVNEQVKRNNNQFPVDFMFQLNKIEAEILVPQNAIPSWGERRKVSYVFTEQGVAAVSAVLKSEVAAEISINIVRTFVRVQSELYHIGTSLKDLSKKWFAFSKMDSIVKDV